MGDKANQGVVVGLDGRSTKKRPQPDYYKIVVLVGIGIIIILAILLLAKTHNSSTPSTVKQNPVVLSYSKKLPGLKSAVDKNPKNAADHVAYAEALYVTGNKSAAKSQYLAAAKLDPSNGSIENNLGNTYRDLGDYTAAVGAYEQAIKLSPTNQNAYINLANVQIYTLHKPADGIATYKQAMSKIGITSQFQLLLGLAYEQNGQIALAKETYQAILANDPSNQAAKDNLNRLNQ